MDKMILYTTAVQKKKIVVDASRFLQVAGLIYRGSADNLQILLITSRRKKRWIVPKGWPHPGKTLSNSALQEVFEEAGVRGTVCEKPIGRYKYTKLNRSLLKELNFCVDVFPISFSYQEKEWPEKEQREQQWFSPKEAASNVKEIGLKTILENFSSPSV